MSNEYLPSASPEKPSIEWVIEEIPTSDLSPKGAELYGFRLRDPNANFDEGVHGRTIRISGEGANTEERAQSLRHRAEVVLSEEFGILGSALSDALFVLGEMIQNAQRHSLTGPIWMTISTVDSYPGEIDITVVNGAARPVKSLDLPDDEHGWGEDAVRGFALAYRRVGLDGEGVIENEGDVNRIPLCIAAVALMADGKKPPQPSGLSAAA